ncbi:hypothetical protein BV20DRAFT_960611 [Pilatotrama ljubarskyi]|nr:hypothetical protein BV20DRAFT_960611 [Pilatotrama ljubarskyi]
MCGGRPSRPPPRRKAPSSWVPHCQTRGTPPHHSPLAEFRDGARGKTAALRKKGSASPPCEIQRECVIRPLLRREGHRSSGRCSWAALTGAAGTARTDEPESAAPTGRRSVEKVTSSAATDDRLESSREGAVATNGQCGWG